MLMLHRLFRKSSLGHAHLRNRVAMVAMRFDVGVPAAEPSCSTAPLSTSRRRRAQRARAHARVVLGVVRAVEALHGISLARTADTPHVQKVQKHIEMLHIAYIDKVVDVPVEKQVHVPHVQNVQKHTRCLHRQGYGCAC